MEIRSNMVKRYLIPTISIVIFITSLTQNDFCTTRSCGDSIASFISGFIGVFMGGATISWLANPLLFVSWGCFLSRSIKTSLIISLLALLLSLSFLTFKEVMVDEAGHMGQIISYQAGYWLWVLSALTMVIGNGVSLLLLKHAW
jgi:hypothetical protein